MPFTPAHIAAVIPALRSKYASATGLVVGSMAPDFEYFMKMSVNGVHGHTWAGLLYFDLPVSVIVALLFHLIVKKNLIRNLPRALQKRFRKTWKLNFLLFIRHHPLLFFGSALAGSVTHIVWDSFTHNNGFFVNYFSFYDGSIVPFQGVDYPLWYALQNISTFGGLTILVAYVFLGMKKGPSFATPLISYWVVLSVLTVFITGMRFVIYSEDYKFGNLVVTAIGAFCIALVCCGLMPFRKPATATTP